MEKPSMIFAKSSRRCAPGGRMRPYWTPSAWSLWRADAGESTGDGDGARADAAGDFAWDPSVVPLMTRRFAPPTWTESHERRQVVRVRCRRPLKSAAKRS